MIKIKLPKVASLEFTATRLYPSPLSTLYVDFLSCLARVQRQSREHVLLPERVPAVSFRSSTGQYIAEGSHPLRGVLRGSAKQITPRDLSIWEARAATPGGMSPEYSIMEIPEDSRVDRGGLEIAQCKAILLFLEQTPPGTAVVIEVAAITCPVTLLAVETFAYYCDGARIVHTLADDRIYLVGRVKRTAKKEDIRKVLEEIPEDASKVFFANILVEAVLVKAMGEIYTWKCNTMARLVDRVNQANESHAVKDLRRWLDQFIEASFKDQSEKWIEATGWETSSILMCAA